MSVQTRWPANAAARPEPRATPRVVATAVLAAVGLVLAGLLWRSHLAVFAGGAGSGFFCSASARFDCDAVAAHPSSWVAGFPLPLLGLLFYASLLLLAVAAACLRGPDRRAVVALARIAATLAVAFDLYLALVLWIDVGALCSLCLATYAVNLTLALVLRAWDRALPPGVRWRRLVPNPSELRGADGPHHREAFKLAYLGLGLVLLFALHVAAVLPFAEARARGSARLGDLLLRMATTAPTIEMSRFHDQPASGAPDARVQLAVVGDFECAYCRSTARSLRRWQAAFPERLRVTFINSPLSSRCNPAVPSDLHEQACWLAEIGEAAALQGRFWELHDDLFAAPVGGHERAAVLGRLEGLGLDRARLERDLATGVPAERVRSDVALCAELGLTATPSLVLGGHALRGGLPPWLMDELMGGLLGARD